MRRTSWSFHLGLDDCTSILLLSFFAKIQKIPSVYDDYELVLDFAQLTKTHFCLSTPPFPLSWSIYIYYAQLRPHIILFLCHCLCKEICNLIIYVGAFQLYFFLFNLLPDENTINLYVPCTNEPYVYIQP